MNGIIFFHIKSCCDNNIIKELRILSPEEVLSLANKVKKGFRNNPFEYQNEPHD